MIDQDNILLILNCRKYRTKALYQKETWLKNIPIDLLYFHVIGEKSMDSVYKFDHQNKILWVRVEDDYISLPKKVITAYHAVTCEYNFKFIFKTDDDQILVKPHFLQILPSLIQKKNSHYGGFVVKVDKPYLSQYHNIHPELPQYIPILKTKYCSGRFYFLSMEAINDLLSKRVLVEKECLEDYAIGYNLAEKFKENMLPIFTNTFFTDIELSDYPTWVEKVG
jgi:hypothetical protein